MGKNFKKYNPNTQQWEIIASGNASGISTTNPKFLNGQTQISVDEALDQLSNDIDKLKGNVSWLAQYGGGGGGGGGESYSATIKLVGVEDNKINLTTEDLTVRYIIDTPKPNLYFQVSVTLDGTIVSNKTSWSGIEDYFYIPNIRQFSSNSTHNIVITAIDQDGMNLEPIVISVVESSIYLSVVKNRLEAVIGLDCNIEYQIVSKVLDSDISLIVTNTALGITNTFSLGKASTTDPIYKNISFFDLFGGAKPNVGSSYTIKSVAQTSINGQPITSQEVIVQVVVSDGETLVVLVDGCTTAENVEQGEEPTKFTSGGNLSFTFTPYLSGVTLIYYAAKLTQISTSKVYTVGIFDPDPSKGEHFSQNSYCHRGSGAIFTWPIDFDPSFWGDWDIVLRCWSEKGNPIKDTHLKCKIVQAAASLIPNPNPNNRRYATWNIKSATFPQLPSSSKWTSVEDSYRNPWENSDEEAHVVNSDLNVYSTNGILSGFLVEGGQPKLRLASESHGVINVQPFNANFEEDGNWGKHGFTLTITYKTDTHPFNDRTVFSLGTYLADGTFSSGFRITLEDVTWTYNDGDITNTLSCKVQQNVINTVTFVLNPNQDKLYAAILVNGAYSAAQEITKGFRLETDSKIYLACDNINNKPTNFADVEFYDISLYRTPLNDRDAVILKMNTHAVSKVNEQGEIDFTLYNNEKVKNFFSASNNDPVSLLWDNDRYKNLDFALLNASNPPLPVMLITCTGSGFTKSVYEALGQNTNVYSECTMTYFDPKSENTNPVSTDKVSIMIQGTSSTGYRSKNLDIRFDKDLYHPKTGDFVGKQLFQPKKTWMPENQFTLKADVVDSAHANNASIGKWINENADVIGLLPTPPMEELKNHKPKDSYDTSKTQEDVTIKHTLEGFPIILLIQFDGSSAQEMLGIYSLNLGRSSYFNMGFQFFKSFSIDECDASGAVTTNNCPAFVTSYELYTPQERFGSIDQTQIYSYEFTDNQNNVSDSGGILPVALFWQDDLSILKHVGEFKYNGSLRNTAQPDDNVWRRLQLLFSCTAQMTDTDIPKYGYNIDRKAYEQIEGQYAGISDYAALASALVQRINLNNAYIYYMICIAFGLVDSLGKNMTLRSWNVGGDLTSENNNMWWPCFYDMDTSNGLTNTGTEEVPTTAYIDTYHNYEVESGVNSLYIKSNDANGSYDTYDSRLWDLLRHTRFLASGVEIPFTYEKLWKEFRRFNNNVKLLNDPNHFIDNYFSYQTKDCGELLYNYDYTVKYLTKYVAAEGGEESYANIRFLHGTRTNYVRNWLTKRWMFLDCVFKYDDTEYLLPYNQKGQFNAGGAESGEPKLVVKSNCPLIFTVNMGQTVGGDISYMLEENVPTEIVLPTWSDLARQVTINGLSQISLLDGLKDIRFRSFVDITLPALSELDLSGVTTLSSQNPVPFNKTFVNSSGVSDIRHIDLSNTKFYNNTPGEFPVDIAKYNKLKTVDISNSCVTSISLPSSALTDLNITNSNVSQITLKDQAFLYDVDFNLCNKLGTINIENCSKIESLDLSSLTELHTVNITGCNNLKEVICKGNTKLTTFNISGCNKVSRVDLEGCTNTNLKISIINTSLADLNLRNTNTTSVVEWDEEMPYLTTLNLNNASVKGFKYGNNPVATYKEETVSDLSRLKALKTLNVKSYSADYIKFNNSKTSPFSCGYEFFLGSSVKRIFGHLLITSYRVFYNCKNLQIHDLPDSAITPMPEDNKWFGPDCDTEEGRAKWENNESLDTNLRITSTTLSELCANSNVNLYDVYYILSKCDGVTNINYLFYGCYNIKVSIQNSLHRDTFKHCTNVTSATYLFYSSLGSTILRSPKSASENGLLTPLKNLTSYSYLLGNARHYFDSDLFTTYDGSKFNVTSISRFLEDCTCVENSNVSATSASNLVIGYCDISKILSQMPKLKSLDHAFTGFNMNFTTSLHRYWVSEDEEEFVEYCNVFYNNPNLTSVFYSLNGDETKGSLTHLFGGNDILNTIPNKFPRNIQTIEYSFRFSGSNKALFPIHNSMFKYTPNLTRICGYQTGTDSGYSFTGLNKRYYKEDESEVFCYDIFQPCKNATHLIGFFSELQSDEPIDIELPGDLFRGCTKLVDVSYMFYGMGSNVRYTLSSKGFKDCNIQRAGSCFRESGGRNKHGEIPYGLFYKETTTTVSKDGYNSPEDTEVTRFTYTVTKPTTNVVDMNYIFAGSTSEDLEPYKLNYGDLSYVGAGDVTELYGDLIIKNPDYDPVPYIKKGKDIIPNPTYNPYTYAWNRYALDGDYSNLNMIEQSDMFTSDIDIDKSALKDMFDPLDAEVYYVTGNSGLPSTLNYLCSPDVFRYCKNAASTLIYGAFDGCGIHYNTSDITNHYAYGVKGRIPRDLFKPVNLVNNLSYMFRMCTAMIPYKWPSDSTTSTGTWISKDLFNGMRSLDNLNYAFAVNTCWSRVVLSPDTFTTNTELKSIQGIFNQCRFVDSNNKQIPDNLFNQNTKLTNIKDSFNAYSPGTLDKSSKHGYIYIIGSGLFNANRHKSLSDISYAFAGQSSLIVNSSSVPPFWDWLSTLDGSRRQNVFYEVPKDLVKDVNWQK